MDLILKWGNWSPKDLLERYKNLDLQVIFFTLLNSSYYVLPQTWLGLVDIGWLYFEQSGPLNITLIYTIAFCHFKDQRTQWNLKIIYSIYLDQNDCLECIYFV